MTILNKTTSDCPLKEERVREALKCLRLLNEKETKNKSDLFNEDESVLLQVALKRIPKLRHILALRLNLKHPIVKDHNSICLITKSRVKDSREYEDDVAYWQELLKKKDVEVGTIIPYKQLQTEYKTYEARKNLCHGFEVFLVDGSLTSTMPTALGKSFVQSRKMPYSVNMDEKRVKKEIERALKKTTLNINGKGPVSACGIGYLGRSDQELLDNVTEVAADICRKLPGGWKNVNSLHLKFPRSIALPIYMSFDSADKVVLEKLIDDEETIVDDVTTLSRSMVKIHSSLKVDLLKEEPEDLTELEHTALPFEDHDLALQEVEALKKKFGKKKISEKKLLTIIKKREGRRKRMLEKLKLKAELQEQANFKEAEALKASQSNVKKTSVAGDVKSKTLFNVVNPFSSVGEKFLKKSIQEKEVKMTEDASSGKKKKEKKNALKALETLVSPLKKKLTSKQKKEAHVKSSPKSPTQERIEKREQKTSSILNMKKKKKKRRRAMRKPKATKPEDVPEVTTKTEMLQKRFEQQKLKSRKRKDSSENDNPKIAHEASPAQKKTKKQDGKKAKQGEKQTVLEKTNAQVQKIKSGKSKAFKSESPKITSQMEKSPLKARMSLTSQVGKLGSLRKKKSYNLNHSQSEKMSSMKKGPEQNQPKLLSFKKELLEESSWKQQSSPKIKGKKNK